MNGRNDEVLTVIGQGSLLEGTLEIDHAIQVDGTFRGRVTTPTSLLVNDGGEVVADRAIEVGSAVIHGIVTGAIHARDWVRLGATARMRGVLQTPRLIIEEGAMIEVLETDPA